MGRTRFLESGQVYTISYRGTLVPVIVNMSSQSLLLALILAGSQCLGSQEAPAEKRKDLATIEGRAVNSVTGEPLVAEGITLRALPPGTGSLIVQSDAEGRFTFDDMEPGSYVLCVRRIGDDGMPVKLSAGQVLKDVELKVAPTGGIRGMVVDGEGKPLPNVLVTARGSLVTISLVTSSTNKAGEFRLPGLVSGSYVLVAAPVPSRMLDPRATTAEPDKTEERLLTTYYPAATDASLAEPLEVAPGQELQGITIVIRKGRVYHVQGTVIPFPPDVPLADVRLMLTPRMRTAVDNVIIVALRDTPTDTRTPKRDGSFDLGDVQPGSYYLTARRQNLLNVTLGHVQVDVYDADVTGVVLKIGEPRQVHGTVRMEGQDQPDFAGVRIQLALLDNLMGRWPVATVDSENAFALKDVPPDRLLVAVTGLPEKAYVKSIQMGGQETIDSGLDLTDIWAVPPLEILVGPNGATVEGTVTLDSYKPAPGAWVCLVPEPPRPELTYRIKSATATGDGKFTFAGVAPGEYRLYALDQLKRDPYGDLEFLKPFESRATKLTVKEGERKRADLIVRANAR
jgi:hypothetical protein